jgi:cytochrome oxidase Cu insertion factor (SCO1/SenC/PrrC family)
MALSGRQTLLLIAAVCVLPVAASYWAFYFMPPRKTMNYGDLIEPRPLPPHRLTALDGTAFSLDDLRGRWVMLAFDSSACGESCRQKLYYMRQVRKAQGPEMDRIERVWLLTDAGVPAGDLLRDYEGMHIARPADENLAAAMPAGRSQAAHIYLIDPLGNLMLRYPENPDPKRMIKDFERLLKYSRIG